MSADEAAEALQRLGLSNYEARVFVALQQLGEGTAQDVSRVSDVPRPQVYGVAEDLAERGLVELVETSPKRYRPVSLAAAREQLSRRLDRETDRAFENLASVREEHADRVQGTDVTTLRGRPPVQERVVELIERADDRVVYVAPSAEQAPPPVADALDGRAAAGVEVTLMTADGSLRERFEDVRVVVTGDDVTAFTGRTLLVDEATVLLSVVPETGEELALWTADTSIGRILAQFVHAGMKRGM